MKKVTLMLTALALVLGISQCKKQENPVPVGEKQFIELTADNGNDGSKVSGSFSAAAMNLVWDDGDVITVSGGAEGTLTLDRGAGTSQGHFAGEVKLASRADLVFTWTNLEGEPEYNNQAGTEDWIKDNLVLEARNAYNDNGKYSLKMEMPYAVLKLNLNALVGESGNDVEISTGSDPVATVKNLTKANSEEVYMAVPEVGEHIYTFSGNDASAKKPWTLEANTYYTADTEGAAIVIEPSIPEGTLSGLFSVASGTTVEFAPGNLQYVGSTQKWQFAASQYEFIGATLGQNTNSSTATRDLFGWGCTGNQDTRKDNHTKWYQTNYRPYSTSSKEVIDTDPVYYINRCGYGPDYVSPYYNLTVENKSDWGCLEIGTYPAGTWRTLSSAEWAYLLNTRSGQFAPEIGDKTDCRYALVKVNGKCGMMIFPDVFAWPSSVTKTPATFNKHSSNWNGVNYEVGAGSDFEALESAGVVFLPAVGYRSGTSFSYVGEIGYYWSSSCRSSQNAHCMVFYKSEVSPQNSNKRYLGLPVRLVR